MTLIKQTDPVLLVGSGDLVAGIAMCLLNAGHQVNVCTWNVAAFEQLLKKYIVSQKKDTVLNNLNIDTELQISNDCKLVIAVTEEDEEIKRQLIKKLESLITKDTILAINTESIDLNTLQTGCIYPG
ncbi:MAG: 3-hydroxyacyl-CoA dehydrogenase NAD-binding domain-containing protein, partial [Pedobacter sp.]